MHCKITLYPLINLIILCACREEGGSLRLITSTWWLEESLSGFDYASWRRLPRCLPFSVTPFVQFTLFSLLPLSSRTCRLAALRSDGGASFVRSWRIDSASDSVDLRITQTHTASHVHTGLVGKVVCEIRDKRKMTVFLRSLEEQMAHDTHVFVSLKSFYE